MSALSDKDKEYIVSLVEHKWESGCINPSEAIELREGLLSHAPESTYKDKSFYNFFFKHAEKMKEVIDSAGEAFEKLSVYLKTRDESAYGKVSDFVYEYGKIKSEFKFKGSGMSRYQFHKYREEQFEEADKVLERYGMLDEQTS